MPAAVSAAGPAPEAGLARNAGHQHRTRRARTRTRSRGYGRGRGRRQGSRRDDGYSVVEAVITLPVLIVMVMFVVQYALLWHGRHVAGTAAQNGLREARGYQSDAAAGERSANEYLREVAPNLLTRTQVTAQRDDTAVTVTVRAKVLSIVPFGRFDISETAAGPVERFIAPDGR